MAPPVDIHDHDSYDGAEYVTPRGIISGSTDFTSLSRFDRMFAFMSVTSLFFIWGLSYGLVDVLNKHFLDIFNLTKTQSTLLQFAYFGAYLVFSPIMGVFMRRFGYKAGIHVGLGLFSIGTILFWPSAVYRQYGMFVAFTFITGCGLATLEVAANSYIVVLGEPKYAARRLVTAQTANGVATILGPIIAAHTFFKPGDDPNDLSTVQYVYLAMSMLGVVVNIFFYFAKLPEVRQVVTSDQEAAVKGSFLKQYHTIFGFVAEWFYVGAQVAVASFAMFYITEQPGINPPISSSTGSNMFSGMQGVFTAGRMLGIIYLRWIDPAFALFFSGIMLVLFSILTSLIDGKGGIACLYFIFLFESSCYPIIFSIATADLGSYQKLGSGLLAMGVSGGAAYPSLQGVVADHVRSQISYLIPMTGFVVVALYGGGMWVSRSRKYSASGLTIWAVEPQVADILEAESNVKEKELAYGSEKVEDLRIERA